MPTREEHVEHCEELYDYGFKEIHEWMDGTVASKGRSHREDRHNINETPDKAYEIFRDEVPEDKKKFIKDAVKDHIELDERSNRERSRKKNDEENQKKEYLKIKRKDYDWGPYREHLRKPYFLVKEVEERVTDLLGDGKCPYWIINSFCFSEKRDIARGILYREGFSMEELKGTKKSAVKAAIKRMVERKEELFTFLDLCKEMSERGVPYSTYRSRLPVFLEEIVSEMGGEVFPAKRRDLFLIVPPNTIPSRQNFSTKVNHVFGTSERVKSNPYQSYLHNVPEPVLRWVKKRVEEDLRKGSYPPQIPDEDWYPNFSGVAKAVLYHKGFSEPEIEEVEVYDKTRDQFDRRRWIIESILRTAAHPLTISDIVKEFKKRTSKAITRGYVEHVIQNNVGIVEFEVGNGSEAFLERGNPALDKWKEEEKVVDASSEEKETRDGWTIKNPDVKKPCRESGYCPYGSLAERFPAVELEEKYGCEVFAHICPVYFVGEGVSEKEGGVEPDA